MKKVFLFVAIAAMSITASATDLWTGSKDVTWGAGLQIAATQFASATPGQKIVFHYSDASKGLEFKVMNANFDHLAGSREALGITGNGTVEQFLTQAAVDSLKLYGLELIGEHFTATKVELLDGKTLKEGISVWTGFFWADNYSTLELYRDGYCYVDFSKVSAIRFYSEAAGTDYVLNFKESWEEPAGNIANAGDMTDGAGYKELALTDALRTRLANASHWMIQFNKEALSAFNVTDIVLVPSNTTAMENTTVETKAVKLIENGQVVILKNGIRYNVIGTQL